MRDYAVPIMVAMMLAMLLLASLAVVAAREVLASDPTGCYAVEVTPNTPTGIAGCQRSGEGIASHYGPGNGVAMNFCTWTVRHTTGCGHVNVTSVSTGLTVAAPVVDFCDCYTGTVDERIVDLQWGVLDALGLDRAQGLYPVTVFREGASSSTYQSLPNTAMQP